MGHDRITEGAAQWGADVMLLFAAAGVMASTTNTLLGASSAFTTRLLDDAKQSSQLSALQISSLALALASLRPVPLTASSTTRSTRLLSTPAPGAPVVT